jgi:uncharacterized membrane protein YfcA
VTTALVLVGLGLVTGLLSGLFGLGGGFLLVPALAWLGWPIKSAIGTSLFYVAVIGVSGAYQHLRARNVDLRFVGWFAAAALPAAPLGALASAYASDGWLTLAFGVFLAGVALSMLHARAEGQAEQTPPTVPATLALGGVVGTLSGLFGVGGGLLFVPAQVTLFAIPIKRAIGNSLAGVLLTGIAGTLTHLALGHVDWREGAFLVVGGLVGLTGGTRLLRVTPGPLVRRALMVFLLLIAAQMIWSGLRP